jgi:hypothetical protein
MDKEVCADFVHTAYLVVISMLDKLRGNTRRRRKRSFLYDPWVKSPYWIKKG